MGFFVVSITRAGACVAGGPASTLPDWPAPDGPAALFPSAGVGAVSLALEGRVDPCCEPMKGAVREGTQLGRFRPQPPLGWLGDWEVAQGPCRRAGEGILVGRVPMVVGRVPGWRFIPAGAR